jgi:hypothetical protein
MNDILDDKFHEEDKIQYIEESNRKILNNNRLK